MDEWYQKEKKKTIERPIVYVTQARQLIVKLTEKKREDVDACLIIFSLIC
jgi:hypothetical protein